MPLIPRGSGLGTGNGSFKGYAPKPVTEIKAVNSISEIRLNWTDPEDVQYETATLAKWDKTYLVRKIGDFPKDLKDGKLIVENTVRNQYKTDYFSDENDITAGITYYYRFFTESDMGVINADSTQVIKVTASEVSSILEENSWETIAMVAGEGRAQEFWNVGDEKILSIGGTSYAQDIVMQIWGFGVDDLSAGGKAPITFGSKNLTNQKLAFSNGTYTDWTTSLSRGMLNSDDFLGKFPSELKNIIKSTKVVSHCQDGSRKGIIKETSDKLWIPAWSEHSPCMEAYSIFTNNDSRKKKSNGVYDSYNTRESNIEDASNGHIICITNTGEEAGGHIAASRPICFGFCL